MIDDGDYNTDTEHNILFNEDEKDKRLKRVLWLGFIVFVVGILFIITINFLNDKNEDIRNSGEYDETLDYIDNTPINEWIKKMGFIAMALSSIAMFTSFIVILFTFLKLVNY